MIGIVARESEYETVTEFFQLFKTPWEFYREDRKYNVVIATSEELPVVNADFIIFYNGCPSRFDSEQALEPKTVTENFVCSDQDLSFPVYGHILTFLKNEQSWLTLELSKKNIAIEVDIQNKKVIRIGFDLFQEVYFLLTFGQPVEFSHIPTLDIHIAILRNLILKSGRPLIEIPPVPSGYNFACCLTHDIDFAGIRRHKLDHTILGFLYRSLLGSLKNYFNGKNHRRKLCKNWKAAFMLPFVYMGLAKDFWMKFNRYIEIDNSHSTFFIIPFRNLAGMQHAGNKHVRRAVKYDISDIKPEIHNILSHGCEIGVHGIDAWIDDKKGRKEFERIHEVTGISEIGIRMHWLYFNVQSYNALEKAGYRYDSSQGYNDGIGYKGGTTQVFCPIGLKKLLELPLNIQDTALFYPDRMGLTEEKAWPLINSLLEKAKQYGGALTINWHDRSLEPERLWDIFYINLVDTLKNSNAWFDTGSQVIRWFDKRRSAQFKEIVFFHDKIKLYIESKHIDDVPDLTLRIHKPETGRSSKHIDISFANVLQVEHSIL